MKQPLHSRYEDFYLVGLPFSSDMVRANCDGVKRTTCRPTPSPVLQNARKALDDGLIVMGWVREAWTAKYKTGEGAVRGYFDLDRESRAEAELVATRYRADAELKGCADEARWVPAMHMPFERHRLFMRITAIEPFVLGDMTEKDALDEGMSACLGRSRYGFDESARNVFRQVWEEAYGVFSPSQQVLRVCYERPLEGPVTSYIEIHKEIAA